MSQLFDTAESFLEALPATGALLGLDVGTRKVGIAVSDGLRMVGSAIKTQERRRFHVDAAFMQQIGADRNVVGCVVGLPTHMDGGKGPRAQASKSYGRNVTKTLSLPVLLWDERFSTIEAKRALLSADMSRAKRAEVIDGVAAAVILQSALDRLAHLGRKEEHL